MKHLSEITGTFSKHNVLLVICDCNAHICPEDALSTLHDRKHNNTKLFYYSLEANLIITNTRFQKKQGKLFTFTSD